MFRRFLISTLILLISTSIAVAQDLEMATVTGIGDTKSEAIIDAQRQALTQVVGKYVVSRDILKNRKKLSENVYSYSNGFVSSFEIKGESNSNGLFEITALVGVSRTKLLATIDGLNINRISIGDQAEALASGKASQSKNFAELIREELYGSLFNREVFNVEINKVVVDADIPNDSKIFLRSYFGFSATEIKVGNYFFSESCKNTESCDEYTEGLLMPIMVDVTFQLKKEFFYNLMQLFKNTSKNLTEIEYACEIGCKFNGESVSTYEPHEVEGTYLVSDNDTADHFTFTANNDRILDKLASENSRKRLVVTLSFIDHNDRELDSLKFVPQVISGEVDLVGSKNGAYGQSGLLSFEPIYVNNLRYPNYHLGTFMLGVNTKTYATFSQEKFNLLFPVVVSNKFAGQFKDIVIDVSFQEEK